jgi:hypothetical protein
MAKILAFGKTKFAWSFNGKAAVPIFVKNLASVLQKTLGSLPPSRLDERGVRVVADVEAGCDGRGGDARRVSPALTAKACGPGLPTLRSSARDDDLGGKQARAPIAQGMPDDPAEPAVPAACAFLSQSGHG